MVLLEFRCRELNQMYKRKKKRERERSRWLGKEEGKIILASSLHICTPQLHPSIITSLQHHLKVNYFPSRHDPVHHAERCPIPAANLSARREKCNTPKQNNFKQPGERYRSWAPDRQDRFLRRWVPVDTLFDPRVTHEIGSIWISYWPQADRSLGQKIASHLNMRSNI